VRSMHDRFLQLLALGVTPDHVAFPQQSWQLYVRGDMVAISEDHRSAVGQYIGIVEQLLRADVAFDQPGTQKFLTRMQDNLVGNRAVVRDGAREVSRLLQARPAGATSDEARPAIEPALGDWAEQHKDNK